MKNSIINQWKQSPFLFQRGNIHSFLTEESVISAKTANIAYFLGHTPVYSGITPKDMLIYGSN